MRRQKDEAKDAFAEIAAEIVEAEQYATKRGK